MTDDIGKTLATWWREVLRPGDDNSVARALRARLRRAETLDVLAQRQVHDLVATAPWLRARPEALIHAVQVLALVERNDARSLARVLGAGEDAIHAGLAGAVVCGRVEPVPLDAPFTVVIDYAHNEAAAECLLRTLRAYRPTRLVAVFGCGGARSRLRRFGMGSVCARLADFCIITEDNSRGEPVEHILADIRAGLRLGNPATPFAEIPDRRQAIYYALDHAQPGDIIAILGKGHETTIERGGIKEPFVEREIVEEYWGR